MWKNFLDWLVKKIVRTHWGIERMDYKWSQCWLLRISREDIWEAATWRSAQSWIDAKFVWSPGGIWDILNLWFMSIKPHLLWLLCVFICFLFTFNPKQSYWKSCDGWGKQWILVWSNFAGSIELTSEFLCPMTFLKLLVGFLFAASPHFISLIYRVINLTGLDQILRYFSCTGLWQDAGMHGIPDSRLGGIDTCDHH